MPPSRPASRDADLVVVGAGAAGLFCALSAAAQGARVVLVSATPLAQSSSYWAQGGLAAALAPDDDPDRHLQDTLRAGRGSSRRSAAAVLCSEAPDRVAELERLGVAFDTGPDGRLALGLEGGHSVRRVAHAGGSATGRQVVQRLAARAAEEPAIEVLEERRAVALLVADDRCVGVRAADGHEQRGRAVVLATGGAAAAWARTTNPSGAVGHGLALARAAGATLADLELVQFHPTAVVGHGIDGFLVTEAVRGEGATLLGPDGERFVDELAPRDEVARAIDAQLRAHGVASVGLDLRGVDLGAFPNVVGALRQAGLEPAHAPVPVAPAAHYVMGGVATDARGATDRPGLLAVGECACTGLHGANRLASNSLSECFVFGRRAALAGLDEPLPAPGRASPRHPGHGPPPASTREALWRDAGLVRRPEGLRRLLEDPDPLARLVAEAGLLRAESRGAHRRADRPEPDPGLDALHVVLEPEAPARLERWI